MTYLLNVDTVTRAAEDQARLHSLREPLGLQTNLLLLLLREIDKVVVLCANQKRYSRLIESSTLAIPLLDRIQCALAREIEHEEDGYCVVTYQR